MWGAMKGIRTARLGLLAASLTVTALTTAARAVEGELVKSILGSIGVIPEDRGAIDYRERAPLVLPPRMDLRDPAAPGSAQARNAQWPNDPDVAARRKQAAEDRTPITQTERKRMSGENTRLTAEEMRAGRQAGAGVTTAPVKRADSAWIHPDVLRAQGTHRSGDASSGDDGTRRSLTEPPTAYRQSATGQPIRGTWEARNRVDEADPRVFQREQAARRNQ